MDTALMKRATIEELAARRQRALELYAQGAEMIREALKLHAEAAPAHSHLSGLPRDFGDWVAGYKHPEMADEMRRRVDRDMWRSIAATTRLLSLMDEQEKKAFEKSLEDDPPPCTPETVCATLERLSGEADLIFRRGLVNAFAALCRDYKSNDGFRVGDRTVITHGCDHWLDHYRVNYYKDAQIADIDRCMHVLDGKPAPENYRIEGLVSAINGLKPGEAEAVTPYWRAKCHKNGNVHLWALRRDLLDRVNRLIAEHYGLTLATDEPKRRSPLDEPTKPKAAADLGDFPTPTAVVARLLELAAIEPGMTCLEPSAGAGNIARAMRESGGVVDCVELQVKHANALSGYRRVICGDFLDRNPAPEYDRIVMNPPFHDGAAVRHVAHALRFLRPGGRLVAVMPSGVQFRTDRLHADFRERVAQAGGRFEALPEDAFGEVGTGCRTVVLVADHPDLLRAQSPTGRLDAEEDMSMTTGTDIARALDALQARIRSCEWSMQQEGYCVETECQAGPSGQHVIGWRKIGRAWRIAVKVGDEWRPLLDAAAALRMDCEPGLSGLEAQARAATLARLPE